MSNGLKILIISLVLLAGIAAISFVLSLMNNTDDSVPISIIVALGILTGIMAIGKHRGHEIRRHH